MNKEIQRFLFFLAFTCLALNHEAKAQKTTINPNGYNVFFYDNGVKSSEGFFKDGIPDGYWINYYPNGIKTSEGNRKENKLDSIWKFYSEEGILREEIAYKNNQRQGLRKIYSKDGFLEKTVPYSADKINGLAFDFYTNGAINIETPYVDGLENGLSYVFSETGEIITLKKYENGILINQDFINRKNKDGEKQGVWKEFYEDRTVKTEGRYEDSKKQGYWKEYAPNGELIQTLKYHKGELISDAEELSNLDIKQEFYTNSDGKVRFRGSYRKGLAEGTHIWYNIEGNIDSTKQFKQGKLVGEGIMDAKALKQGYWKEYYFPEGKLKAEGMYKDGYRNGSWSFYYLEGSIEETGNYGEKEKLEGIWKWFYKSGQLLREEQYKNGKESGRSIEYCDTGKVIVLGQYINGKEEGEWFYEIGDHQEKGNYENGMKQGIWKHTYLTTGKLRFEGEYYEDLPQGKHTWYYENGQKMLEGEYISGEKEGLWKRYLLDGTVSISIEYKNGKEEKVDGYKIKTEIPEHKPLE